MRFFTVGHRNSVLDVQEESQASKQVIDGQIIVRINF